MRKNWHYFPREGDLCLLGIRGMVGHDWVEGVHFTLLENFPPFAEVKDCGNAPVSEAEATREALIREHVTPGYRSKAAA